MHVHPQRKADKVRFVSPIIILVCAYSSTLAEPIQMATLNGQGAFVELPRELAQRSTGVTIETWVRWHSFNKWARVFDFGKKGNAMVLQNEKNSSTINFSIFDKKEKRHRIQVKKIIRTDQWFHLAATCGPKGMNLYINGALAGAGSYSGSISEVSGGSNFLGKSNWPNDEFFSGDISRFAFWDKELSQDEVRESMLSDLTGSEDLLIALYDFTQVKEGGAIVDVTGKNRDAYLRDGAEIVSGDGPSPASEGADYLSSSAYLQSEIVGKTFFLKQPVIRIQKLFGGDDATNILPGGQVQYRATIDSGWRRTESTSAEDFAEQARTTIASSSNATYRNQTKVRYWDRGSEVFVHNASIHGKVVWIDLTVDGGAKTRARHYFEYSNFSIDDLEKSLNVLYAKTPEELMGAENTIELSLGMSVDDVIKMKGNPNTKVNLGGKTILGYEDMKLIFVDGKLADVQ